MKSQLQVIGNQERTHTGLVMKTSYTKKGLEIQSPATLPSGLPEKAIRNDKAQAHRTAAQNILIPISKAEASSADVQKVSNLSCNNRDSNKLIINGTSTKTSHQQVQQDWYCKTSQIMWLDRHMYQCNGNASGSIHLQGFKYTYSVP